MSLTFEIAFVLLFAIATAVAILARKLKAPYTVALVITGMVLGTIRAFEPPHLTKELLFGLFLPGLLFEAAFHIEIEKFRKNAITILLLAIPGVAVAMALTSAGILGGARAFHLSPDFGLNHVLVFSALIAATDPISVVALFKSLGAPRRLGVIVEAESLVNDGTAVVFFTLTLMLFEGHGFSVGGAIIDFFKIVGLGILAGAVVAFAASTVMRWIDDSMIEITLTTVTAYGSFALAEQFHASGVMATVTSGMILGNYARRHRMGPSTRIAVEAFWEYVAFALNSVVFLLIGFQVQLNELLRSWQLILLAYVAVTLARGAVVFGATGIMRRSRERVSWRWSAIMTWGGLRGALSMVLVLATPADFPYRRTLVTMTYGVVLLSLLLQGLTTGPLLRWLKIADNRGDREAYDRVTGKRRVSAAALSALAEMVRRGNIHETAAARIRGEYERALKEADATIEGFHLAAETLIDEEVVNARRALFALEKDHVIEEQRRGLVDEHTSRYLLADVDARVAAIAPHDKDVD